MFQSIVEAVIFYAENQPNKLCLADDHSAVTYEEYAKKILSYAAFFSETGFQKGNKIIVEANQTINYLAIQMALQLLGIVFVPVEHNCAIEKIHRFIEQTSADAVITNNNIGTCENCLSFSYLRLNEINPELKPYTITSFPNRDDVCEILFSTGTTGKEKGIVITHQNNIALAQNVMYGVDMKKDNVEMIPSPMNHSHGLRRYYANMYNGSSVVLLGSVMDMKRFFDNINRYGVNSMDLVPSALAVVLRLSKGKLAEYEKQLRYIQFGSAPIMEGDVETVCKLLPNTRMYNFYGSTESGCSCIYDFNCENPKKNCIGKPAHNTVLTIVDDDRKPIQSSPEHTGLIATSGRMNMQSYWCDEQETLNAMENGTVYSNDVGYIDCDGDIILLGRKGDVINVGGNKVSPEEIENAAKKMPAITDCACIPVSDSAKGQIPKLFVQTAIGAEFNPIEIRGFLAKQLEPYKVPAVIENIDKIPRSFNGKILRKELR